MRRPLSGASYPFSFDLTGTTAPSGLTFTRSGGTLYPQSGISSVVATTSSAIIDNWGGGWGSGIWTFPAYSNAIAKPFGFTAADGWTLINAPTIANNIGTAPDGTTTAAKYTETAGTHQYIHQDALGAAYPITAATVWIASVNGDLPTVSGGLSARNDSGAAVSMGSGINWRRYHATFNIGANVAGYPYIHPVGVSSISGGTMSFDTTAHGSVYLWGAQSNQETYASFLPLINGSTTSATISVSPSNLANILSSGDLHIEGAFLIDPVNNAASVTATLDDPSHMWLFQAQTPNGEISLQWGGQTNIQAKINGLNVINSITLVQNVGFLSHGSVTSSEFRWELFSMPSIGKVGAQFWINGTRDASNQMRAASTGITNAAPTSFFLGSKTDGTGIISARHTLLRTTTRNIDLCEGLVFGDSITAIYSPMTGSYQWIYTLNEGRSREGIVSYSYPGERVDQQQARYDSCAQKGKSYVNWIFLMCGVNDVMQGATSATVISRIQSFVNDINTNNPNARIILAPITPCESHVGATEWTTIQAINTAIAGGGGTPITGSNLIVMSYWNALDAGYLASGTANGVLAAQYDSGDGLHPNDLGRSTIIGPSIATTLHNNGLK